MTHLVKTMESALTYGMSIEIKEISMEKFSVIFERITKFTVSAIDLLLSFAICYQVYVLSGSWILAVLAYPALLVVQSLFIGCFFVRELTLDEDKLQAAVDEAHPYILLLDAIVYAMLTFI